MLTKLLAAVGLAGALLRADGRRRLHGWGRGLPPRSGIWRSCLHGGPVYVAPPYRGPLSRASGLRRRVAAGCPAARRAAARAWPVWSSLLTG